MTPAPAADDRPIDWKAFFAAWIVKVCPR